VRKSVIALLLFTLGSTFAVQAADEAKPFITSQELDLTKYLPDHRQMIPRRQKPS